DDAFGPGDAGQRAELRVAALDELPKCWHIEPRRRSFALDTSKLAHVAIKRAPFPVVVIRHVDHERWSRGVVDEVVSDPLGLPCVAFRPIPPKRAVKRRLCEQRACRLVIRMPV